MKTTLCILLWLVFAALDLCGQPWSDVTLSQPTVGTNAAPADGPNVWYWAGNEGDSGFTGGETSTAYAPQSYSYGSIVTNVVAGTCTKLAIKARANSGTVDVKLSLFDNSGNRVSSATADVVNVGASTAWYEVTLATPVAVTAATKYYIRCSAASDQLLIQFTSVANFGVGDAIAYASFPPSSLARTAESFRGGFKMYVD